MNQWSALVSAVLVGVTAMAFRASPPADDTPPEPPVSVSTPEPEVTPPPVGCPLAEEDTIHIIVTQMPVSTPEPVELTAEEEEMLLKLGMAEAGTQSVRCIASVMRTVLNRRASGMFPDDVAGVIFQDCQFTPVLYGSYYDAVPNEKCHEALGLIKAGWDDSLGSLYFETACDHPTWHSQNLEFLFRVDDMVFYKE